MSMYPDALTLALAASAAAANTDGDGVLKDTTYTKIFVGGLPYTTDDDSLKKFFVQFGEIEEAVVITDRQTGKSRGYGFVTMKDLRGAEKACKDPNPIIDGRKANVNLAYLGAKPRGNVQLASLQFPILGQALNSAMQMRQVGVPTSMYGLSAPVVTSAPIINPALSMAAPNAMLPQTAANTQMLAMQAALLQQQQQTVLPMAQQLTQMVTPTHPLLVATSTAQGIDANAYQNYLLQQQQAILLAQQQAQQTNGVEQPQAGTADYSAYATHYATQMLPSSQQTATVSNGQPAVSAAQAAALWAAQAGQNTAASAADAPARKIRRIS